MSVVFMVPLEEKGKQELPGFALCCPLWISFNQKPSLPLSSFQRTSWAIFVEIMSVTPMFAVCVIGRVASRGGDDGSILPRITMVERKVTERRVRKLLDEIGGEKRR